MINWNGNGCYWEAEKLLSKAFWFFSVDNDSAVLQISTSKFENWRFRQRSVIHIYKGEVILTDVDFENTEASSESMAWGEDFLVPEWLTTVYHDKYYAVAGIISATKKEFYTNENNIVWDASERVPAPSGKFTWKGGSVTGHNIDMNPMKIDDYERFVPFLSLNRLELVDISGITFTHNFMMETAWNTWSLLSVVFCSKAVITDLHFEKNWLDSGAIGIFLMKEYVDHYDYIQ